MLIIGIDPGISGSICFFLDGIIQDVVEMPTMTEGKKNKKQVNGSQIFNEINDRIEKIDKKNIKVVIEQVSAMPGQGVTSMFNFGQSFGILKGICFPYKHSSSEIGQVFAKVIISQISLTIHHFPYFPRW